MQSRNYKVPGNSHPRTPKIRKVMDIKEFCNFLTDDGICEIDGTHCNPDSNNCRRFG